jgi:hypothetical protein
MEIGFALQKYKHFAGLGGIFLNSRMTKPGQSTSGITIARVEGEVGSGD